jgi:putative oxidoreductase
MKLFDKIDQWSGKHHPLGLDFLRVVLGFILLWKGIVFGQNQKDIQAFVDNGPFDFISLILVQYILMAHIAGGVLIILGLVTRTAVLFQLPILAGAVIFTPASPSMAFYSSEFLAVVTLLLLIGFLFYGSGAFSADEYLRRHPQG